MKIGITTDFYLASSETHPEEPYKMGSPVDFYFMIVYNQICNTNSYK